ncbi:hypothetical protein [Saccharospirillum salsuginis]|uniref:Uncharacterized protein n=1 Tax=Saccharospirillum salsuginis TaxID=418750 RepID=A0A918N5G9_9GAMM|nr:hypothetical protein [Saccharospirillum salsuginis]GGX38971.1 hypothetical protein GCM10007392_01560 [Saccharospirillum salsuginis]
MTHAQTHRFDDEHLQSLRASLRGDALLASDAGYDEARTLWNTMYDKRPAVIVQPLGESARPSASPAITTWTSPSREVRTMSPGSVPVTTA